jgi:tRNA (adenine57-N1/adenine58-N1)-methyltransferase catalytic subunit
VPVTVTPDEEYSSRYGAFPHNTMIGKPFGAKLHARNNKGFLYLLRPTPSLWTLSLPHRTQILYLPDIAFIISKLGITPGARVIESGTGSGSMTHALAKAVCLESQVDVRWRGVPGKGASGAGGRRGQRDGNNSRAREEKSTPDTREASADVAVEDGDAAAKTPSETLSTEDLGGPLAANEGRVWSYEFHSERARKAR